jgi:glycosyltransferase involved in cell wall biosynthesis
MEVIVADDGSKDRTSPIVSAAFGNEPRVRLMTMANGGKASALNRALAQASGEIIVALDADTQFEPQTIANWCAGSNSITSARSPAMPRSATA